MLSFFRINSTVQNAIRCCTVFIKESDNNPLLLLQLEAINTLRHPSFSHRITPLPTTESSINPNNNKYFLPWRPIL
nr:hypothetical protein Iba_chr13aCG7540 [Ipomoea batatas]GMD76177.1 hypothetical protein Iba_chr13bCG7820 [Ipomoea batatas]GMD78040.1 hypothetical protein Iba_chr13cCG9130 [Ipomoea batatas]GMD82097.1 hypothetical protein Iba_chr13fCG4780 [Ipomoea batatas]